MKEWQEKIREGMRMIRDACKMAGEVVKCYDECPYQLWCNQGNPDEWIEDSFCEEL